MPRALPPLESLRVLAACVRHGSFSRAAKDLGLTPAAVSIRMRDLEAQLGIPLFHRHGPRLTVSEQGEILAEMIDVAMSLIHSAIERCRSTQPALRVTSAPTFASRWLVPRLEEYHGSSGAQPIELDATSALLSVGQFDVAIRSGTGALAGLCSAETVARAGNANDEPGAPRR